MAVRNYQELSTVLMNIAQRLLLNQNLCKLLYYNDLTPLAKADIADTKKLLNKQIRFIPKVGPQETTQSKIVLIFSEGSKNLQNNEIVDLVFNIYVYTPFTEWVIEGNDLRVFLIMAEIEKTLQGKEVNGVGRLWSSGFNLDLITDEISAYRMDFKLDVFS